MAIAAQRVLDWPLVVESAEDHGLAPLVRRHIRGAAIPVPPTVSRQLEGLVVRHRVAVRVLTDVLCEIVSALDAAGIEHLVLKGAALAHGLYPKPELRPMRDLDILVEACDARRAQQILRGLGFDAPTASRQPHAHHHLPIATSYREGLQISVEVHDDAFSRDWPGTLTMRTLSGPPRAVVVNDRRFRSFGHVDMLRHLSAHALEPRADTRLIGVVDLVEYAARYAQDIDWDSMRREHGQVVNAISLMHYVTPLPAALASVRPVQGAPVPPGAGRGVVPLGVQRLAGTGVVGIGSNLLYPSEWWLRAYYGVPPHRPVFPTRWGRHLWRVAYWGLRRLVAAHASSTRASSREHP